MKTNGPKAFTIGTGGVSANRLVKLDSSGGVVHNTATATDDPIGVSLGSGDAGDEVSVEFLNKEGTLEIEAAGAIELGAEVFAAAAGKIQELPEANGTYRRIGKALQAASGSGSIIEVLAYDYQDTETVSG
jgi:hypothetical protein